MRKREEHRALTLPTSVKWSKPLLWAHWWKCAESKSFLSSQVSIRNLQLDFSKVRCKVRRYCKEKLISFCFLFSLHYRISLHIYLSHLTIFPFPISVHLPLPSLTCPLPSYHSRKTRRFQHGPSTISVNALKPCWAARGRDIHGTCAEWRRAIAAEAGAGNSERGNR